MKGSWIGNLTALALMGTTLAVSTGVAQAQDFPTFKGDFVRTGKSSAYNSSGPGSAKLTWYRPNFTDNVGSSMLVDNIFLPNPNTDPAYVAETGTWATPTEDLAGNPYEPTDIDAPSAGVQYPPQPPRPPAYRFAEAIASATGTDPRLPLNPTDTLSTFTWNLRNKVAPFYEAHYYAIYVHLPTGPTTVSGVQRFPQRDFVYEIVYSGGTYVDVVNTDRSGGGWVRLGNGGLPTDLLFPSDGLNPIQVKLYNTVPRDPSTGILTTNPSGSGNDLDLSQPRPLVYADAVQAIPQVGSYAASPIVSSLNGALGPWRAVAALNQISVGLQDGKLKTTQKGVVTSYEYNTGNRSWVFSPLEESSLTRNMDNLSAGVTAGTSWAAPTAAPIASNFRGTDYLQADVDGAGVSSTVVYDPEAGNALNPGSYDIYVWIPGNSNGTDFAHALQYQVHEGAATTTIVTVDQSGATQTGWVRIGSRRFVHDPNGGNRLTLEVTNFSADLGDATRKAFTDAVRFVGPTPMAIDSTPLQVTARVRMSRFATPEDHPVTIVAAENGTIYCLDATGRGDGTTDILWTYPSTRDSEVPEPAPGDPDTWKDPNLNPPDATNTDWAEIDGTGNQRIAAMPTGFGLSSAAVARIDGEDYLFIGASNGRVYCIEMAGRGDFDTGKRKPGSTRRVWTYPDDFPAASKTSTLGAFVGSVSVADVGGVQTVFVPSMEGRLYALDAKGNAATHTTTALWTYPAMTDPTLGPIAMTPAVDFGKIFFGTDSKDGNAPGQFMALDLATHTVSWTMPATGQPLSGFLGGPVTVPGTDLGGGMTDTVFVSNDNRGIYALDAATGTLEWENYESGASARAPLTYTIMSVDDGLGSQVAKPVIVVPEHDGVVGILNAQTNDLTLAGTRTARSLITPSGSLTSSVAVGWNFMYFGDNAGYLYALSNTAGSFPPGETPPLTEGGGGNTPGYADYSGAKIKLVKQSAFNLLRQGSMYYADALDPANEVVRNPMAFEWGETIYMLVYNFPYKRSGTTVPPVINVNFAVGGQTLRNVFTEARLFPGDSDPSADGNQPFADTDPFGGYAILSFSIQGAGPNALPPGPGQVTVGFNTTDTSGQPVNFPATMTQPFYVANPLALIIPSPGGPDQTIGNTNVTSDAQNLSNGSAAVPNLLGTLGTVGNGQSADLQIGVLDRSLMTLLTGPRKGLNNVRVERGDLAWQPGLTPTAGAGLPLKPIDPTLFPNFEDLPVNYPNNSLDYPDIRRENVTIVKGAQDNSENPVGYPVQLTGPLAADGSPVTADNASTRVLRVTPFDLTLAVPRYQPTNESVASDANGAQVPAGYSGMYFVFVDSSGNGQLDRPGGIQTDPLAPSSTREAYRNFTLSAGVPADQRIAVLTQTVDLGSLAEGAGYTPAAPGPSNALFNPWNGSYTELFKPFEVANEGNVNLLNLRLAKATNDSGTVASWQILSPANEDLAYLDGDYDLWSDMDPGYAPMKDLTPTAPVILQKARVGDRSPRHLSVNPFPRLNANLGVISQDPRLPQATYPVGAPKVAVSIPLGFPSGTYTGLLRVIEDDAAGNDPASMEMNLDANGPTEVYSDPTLRIIFKARETRLTSSFSNFAAPMIDNISNGSENFRFSNLQPSGFRNPTNGGLVTAMSSNRPDWATGTSATAPVGGANSQWRIYVASVQGVDPLTAPGTSPLRDLDAFVPDSTNGRWFVQSPLTSAGFPSASQDATVFDVNSSAGESLVPGTVKYGSPVFPSSAMMDPFRDPATGVGTPLANAMMAFVGEAQVQTPSGRVSDSRIFVAPVTVDGTGAVGIGNIYAMANDVQAAKGRPSIVQTPNSFILFYAATVGGRSSIYFVMPSGAGGASQYDGSYFGDSAALDLGSGFESTWSPSVVGRLYKGIGAANPGGDPVLELSFAGKLRGRPMSEIYYGRISLDGSLAPTGLKALPVRTRERLVSAGPAGTYLADGIQWVRSATISLEVFAQGTMQDIELPNTRVTDRDTGIISFNTRLGGKAYLDPAMGTVRLSGATPGRTSSLYLTYQPKLLRVSEGTSAGYAGANIGYDQRLIPDISYWHRAGDSSAIDNTDPVRTGRMIFTYNRAAAGAGQAARPMIKTMRFGIDLPFAVHTEANGEAGPVSVAKGNMSEPGAIQYFQVDPAKKRIYFTADDEDRTVTVTYEAADEATGQSLGTKQWTARVGLLTERSEELLPLDQSANETNLAMFLDPFDFTNLRRPGLVWLLWSSTRTGSPDVYMQTIAPKFTPVVPSK